MPTGTDPTPEADPRPPFAGSDRLMGQKIHPTGFRIGIMEDWRSRWYAGKAEFKDLLVEDFKVRRYIKKRYSYAGIPKIEIERTRDAVVVLLHTARPGVIIGRKGAEVEKLQEELQALTGRRIEIKIVEVNRPEIVAQLVAEDIAEQLGRRSSFRRTMKRALENTMNGGAKGVKVRLSGRLGGSERCRGPRRRRPGRSPCRRSAPRSITVSPRPAPTRATSASRSGFTRATT